MNTKQTPPDKMTGAAMKGSVNIDGIENFPDAKYWAMGARGAKKRAYSVVPDGLKPYVEESLDPIWKEEHTWMHICIETEKVRDFFIQFMKEREQ